MNTKDLLTIATAALGTATLTVAFFASPPLSGDNGNVLAMTIAKPKLAANGVEMTLSAAKDRVFKAGDQPAFEFHAVNTLKQPAQVAVCVILSGTREVSPGFVSRIPPIPTVMWQDQVDLALQPNESRVVSLTARTNLPANTSFSVSLSQAGDPGKTGNPSVAPLPGGLQGIVSMRFSTVPQPTTPAPVFAATAANPAAAPTLR
jgi:hypothetical protein